MTEPCTPLDDVVPPETSSSGPVEQYAAADTCSANRSQSWHLGTVQRDELPARPR